MTAPKGSATYDSDSPATAGTHAQNSKTTPPVHTSAADIPFPSPPASAENARVDTVADTPASSAKEKKTQGGRKSSAPSKNSGQPRTKSPKTSGGRATSKKTSSDNSTAQGITVNSDTPDASTSKPRGRSAKAGGEAATAKTAAKRSKTAAKSSPPKNSSDPAEIAEQGFHRETEGTTAASPQTEAPAKAGSSGKAARTAQAGRSTRQNNSARGGTNSTSKGRAGSAKKADSQAADASSADTAVSGQPDDVQGGSAKKTGRTTPKREAAKSSRIKHQPPAASSLSVSDPALPYDAHQAAIAFDESAGIQPGQTPYSEAHLPIAAAPSSTMEDAVITLTPQDAPARVDDVTASDPAYRAEKGSVDVGQISAAPASGDFPDPDGRGIYAAHAVSEPADPAEPEPFAPMDFPATFGDVSTEDFFDSLDDTEGQDAESEDMTSADSAQADTSGGEKKRRGRSRRNRGRKKNAAQGMDAGQDNGEGVADPDDAQLSHELVSGDADEADDDADADKTAETNREETPQTKAQRRKMFVSVLPEEQVEVVITEEGQVQEYYVEMLHQAKTKGNIYKAVIHNVDPNLQAAFVSYGAVKNGFLQIDEVHPEYYVTAHDKGKGRKYPPIQKVLKPGQEVLVQVVKEPAGTKGAFLTTYLSIPGRFLVLTPGREQIGVSRKVESEGERARLRELLEGLNPGNGLGVIVRTVSMGASKTSLQRDLQYLKRTWKEVRARGTTEIAPSLIYQEVDLTTRAVRDYLTEAIGEIWIDDEPTAAAIAEIAEALFPRKPGLVRAHKDPAATLFERFNLQRQLDQIHSREVSLPSGGRLVIDPTEALTAIDINSGRSGGKSNFEDMAYRTNMEAAKMIPLQLRLRDIGGQIVADFIEMRDKNHWRDVEKTLRNGMKVDRARYDVGKIGPFGMLEIVRQRLGSSAISISTVPCPCCNGTGIRRNMEWQSQHALRDIHRALRNAQAQNQTEISYQAEQSLALHLLNNKRQRLWEMEQNSGVHIDIQVKLPEVF